MLVRNFLENTAAILPDKTAVVCDNRRWSYAEIEGMANSLAHELIENGVRRGERVVIYLKNCIETIVAIFAILKAGAVFVVVNRTTKDEKLSYILGNCQAVMLITDSKAALNKIVEQTGQGQSYLKTIIICGQIEKLPELGCKTYVWDNLIAKTNILPPPQINIDLDLACLIYTSGTTGEAKGVMTDHSNILFVTASIIEYLQNTSDDIVLNVLPLSFGYGLYQLLTLFRVGGTLILENSFAFPANILNLIAQEKVTGFPAVPTVYAMLLQFDFSKFNLSSLRYMTNAASGLPPQHLLELHDRLPDVNFYAMYGLTEVVRALYLPPKDVAYKPDSVGIAIPGTEVWVENEGERAKPGEVGELVVRGRHVMRGYWQAEELTSIRFRSGQLPGERLCYTDDLFKMDEDGYFYFVSRKDDIIKSRGEKVAPREVEAVLHQLDGVVEAAVIGVPDAILGQAVKAFVIKNKETLNEREVMAYCRAHLEDYMVPKFVEFKENLPKSPSGKVLKRELA